MEGMFLSPHLWGNIDDFQTSSVVMLVLCERWRNVEGQYGSEAMTAFKF
jgi:hypothetical protein